MAKKIKSFLGWRVLGGVGLFLSLLLIAQVLYLGLKWPNYDKTMAYSTTPKEVIKEDSFMIGASKNGTKYYFPHCSGLQRIKPENLIFFATEEAAKTAGYELAKNCENH